MANDTMLIKWLRDAHAMEKSGESILEKQVERLQDYPKVHQRLSEHLQETRRHQRHIQDCIEQLGGDTSTIKELVGKFSGAMQAFGAASSDDEVVKAAINNYQFEALELASYRSLIAAAEVYGEAEIGRICEEILADEEDMSDWLETHVPEVTQRFLSREGISEQTTSRGSGPSPDSRPRA